MSKVTVVLELDDKASKGLKKFGSEAKKAGQTATEKFKATRKELLKVTAVLSGAAIAAKAMWDLASRGVEVRRAEQALEGYAGSAREAAAALEAVQTATDGAVSRTSAMEMAAKLLAMGLATNADEAGRLAEISMTLGASMGIGPQAAFERFTLLLANQSILRLDTFGISATQVRDRMGELVTEGMAPADRQGRFLTATLEQAEIKMQALAEAGFDASSSLDQAASAWEDFKDEVAVSVMEVVEPAAGAVLTLGDFAEMTRRVRDAGYEMESMWYATAAGQDRMTAALQALEVAAQPTVNELVRLAQEQERLQTATAQAVGAEEELQISLESVGVSLGEVTTRMLYQQAAAGLDAEASLGLARAMGVLNEESWVQVSILNDLRAQYDSGAISAGEYTGRMGDLTLALSNLRAAQVGITPAGVAAEMAGMEIWRGEMARVPANIPGRALAGGVTRDSPYVVGERGPELFVPGTSGKVMSNTQLKGAFGGGGGGAAIARVAAVEQVVTQVQESIREQRTANTIMTQMADSIDTNMQDLPRRFAKEILSAMAQTTG